MPRLNIIVKMHPPKELKCFGETTIPEKSKKRYDTAYQKFVKWCKIHNSTNINETVLLSYFIELAKNMKSTTLFANYSMIKTVLNIRENVNIENFSILQDFLRKKGEGYFPRKAKLFTKNQFDKFLREAPNKQFLAMKVIMIFGISGACSCEELTKINIYDIKDKKTSLKIKIRDRNIMKPSSFEIFNTFHIKLYRKYLKLRPDVIKNSRFFVRYVNGNCYRTVIGIHKIESMAKEIAKYLDLPNPTEYTGNSLKRTSESLLVDHEDEDDTLHDIKHEQPDILDIPDIPDILDVPDLLEVNVKVEPLQEMEHLQEIPCIKEEPYDDTSMNINNKREHIKYCLDEVLKYLKECKNENKFRDYFARISLLEGLKKDL